MRRLDRDGLDLASKGLRLPAFAKEPADHQADPAHDHGPQTEQDGDVRVLEAHRPAAEPDEYQNEATGHTQPVHPRTRPNSIPRHMAITSSSSRRASVDRCGDQKMPKVNERPVEFGAMVMTACRAPAGILPASHDGPVNDPRRTVAVPSQAPRSV